MRLRPAVALLAIVCLAATDRLRAAEFELKDGDRVVLLGSTLIEREQRYGYWEAALAARYPDSNIVFRNLAWSGDTIWGDARAGFDTAAQGYERLVALTREVKPTVILICFGTNESFAGAGGLDSFVRQYTRLLGDMTCTGARIVLLSPTPFEKAPTLKDPGPRNADLARYRDAIKSLAAARGLLFADMFASVRPGTESFTDNGMHPTEQGFRALTPAFEAALGLRPEGRDWSSLEPLRRTIVDKNRLFFYRWRPQNETYLLGFRKHEQGKNAKEIVEFDPLVDAKEKEIARLRTAAAPSGK